MSEQWDREVDVLVIGTDGQPIAGLHTTGNTTASVMGRTYPGPGSTIAPAVIFGYPAGHPAAARSASPTGDRSSGYRAPQSPTADAPFADDAAPDTTVPNTA